MTVVNILNKRHKVSKCVIDVLTELYGQPSWLSNPKGGQNPEVILQEWVDELGDYSDLELRMACLSLFKYKKCTSFPSISHVLSMLVDTKKGLSKVETSYKCFSIENELFERDCELKRPFYSTIHYRKAVNYILDILLPQSIGVPAFRELELSCKDDALVRGRKYRKAMDIGLFNELDHLLWQSQNGGIKQ